MFVLCQVQVDKGDGTEDTPAEVSDGEGRQAGPAQGEAPQGEAPQGGGGDGNGDGAGGHGGDGNWGGDGGEGDGGDGDGGDGKDDPQDEDKEEDKEDDEEKKKKQQEMLQKELYKKHMMDEQERRKKELLEQVLARRTAAEQAERYTLQEAEETDADLRAAEAAAETEAAEAEAAEAAKKGEEARGSREKAVEVPLMAVKMEEEDDVEPLQELSSLRKCGYCHQKMYLRKGLCANLMCSAFYMNNPRAPELLCAKGPTHHGAKWSPREWQSSLKDKVECKQLSMAMNESLNEWGEDLALEMRQQKEIPAPIHHEPVIIEDLESGERVEHAPKEPEGP